MPGNPAPTVPTPVTAPETLKVAICVPPRYVPPEYRPSVAAPVAVPPGFNWARKPYGVALYPLVARRDADISAVDCPKPETPL
jgi:hypothetical protein